MQNHSTVLFEILTCQAFPEFDLLVYLAVDRLTTAACISPGRTNTIFPQELLKKKFLCPIIIRELDLCPVTRTVSI